MWRCCCWLLLLCLALGTLPRAGAQDPLPTPTADDISALVKDLDSDKYAARDAATRRLSAAGEAVIEPLSAAAESGSREASTRALEILAQLFDSPMQATRAKARVALEKLAKNDNAAVARRATQVLRPEPPQPALPTGQAQLQLAPRLVPGQGIQIIAGNRLQIGRGNIQVKMVQANNRRAIDVKENDKQIHIDEDERGIDITLTEKVGDQEKVTAFGRKKNLDELKKAEPEAAKLYEKYSGNGRNAARAIGNVQIQIHANGNIQLPPGVPQILPQVVPPAAPPAQQ